MVSAEVEVPNNRETRSYFCALREVRVKVSSKSCESDMVGLIVGLDCPLVGARRKERKKHDANAWEGPFRGAIEVFLDAKFVLGLPQVKFFRREA